MNYFKQLEEDFKRNYTLFVPLSIILQSCIGSIAAMYILQSSSPTYFPFIQLVLCVSITMFFNATVLAQLKPGLIFKMLLLSLVINVILTIFNI